MVALPQYGQGQIVINSPGHSSLKAPATVVSDLGNRVDVVNQHGRATLPKDHVQLQAKSYEAAMEEIREQIARVAQQRDRSLTELRDNVRVVCMKAARESGNEEAMARALKEVGISPKQNKVKAIVQLTVEVTTEIIDGSIGMMRLDRDKPGNRDWWDATVRFKDGPDDGGLYLNEDDDFQPGAFHVSIIDQKIEELTDISYLIGED